MSCEKQGCGCSVKGSNEMFLPYKTRIAAMVLLALSFAIPEEQKQRLTKAKEAADTLWDTGFEITSISVGLDIVKSVGELIIDNPEMQAENEQLKTLFQEFQEFCISEKARREAALRAEVESEITSFLGEALGAQVKVVDSGELTPGASGFLLEIRRDRSITQQELAGVGLQTPMTAG